jgi:hypothetical protein
MIGANRARNEAKKQRNRAGIKTRHSFMKNRSD